MAHQKTDDEVFTALVKSAFDFLNKAIDEFDKSPKFSTIHFAVAIELFLKARLIREHWALLFDKPEKASRAAFLSGQLRTAAPGQVMDRLNNIANVSIPDETRKTFDQISSHRNKMVHFVHEHEAVPNESSDSLSAVASEQCKGWLHLRLLLEKWEDAFKPYQQELATISWKMKKHKEYLQEKFASLSDTISKHQTQGNQVVSCSACDYLSMSVEKKAGYISTGACLVCDSNETIIEIPCPTYKCQTKICLNSYDGPHTECSTCNATISPEYLIEAMDTGEPVTQDNYFDFIEKNCPECGGCHTVVEHYDLYVCTDCLSTSVKLGVCEYCNEGQLGGVPEYSSITGCEFCEGNMGRLDD